MAHVDNLIERIADPHLRAQIAEEVAKLVERKDFGLVFQRHLPEDLEVPGTRPRRGDVVRLRADTDKQNYVVLSVRGGAASVIAVDAAKQTIEGREPATHAFDDLVVVKDFSVPIYPGLEALGEISRGGDKPTHVVIEGENYYALETLLYTHESKVDLIYIDPPYNTGADDWIYNDRFVASTDAYRHSKWLSFMERRLIHAKRLLTDTGVIIVAIGDDEHHRLRMLLDQIYGEQNFVGNIVWQGGGSSLSRFHAGGIDYMLVYARDMSALTDSGVRWKVEKDGLQDVLDAAAEAWEKSEHDSEAASRLLSSWWNRNKSRYDPGLGDNVKVDSDGTAIKVGDLSNSLPRPNLRYSITDPATGVVYEPPENGWRFKRELMDEMIANNRVLFGVRPRLKTPLRDMSMRSVMPSFYKDRRSASQHLSSVLGSKEFPFPKDVDVLARWISIATQRSADAVVLDFFAGTGSTVEAVMRLNAQDGGQRQAIVVTNNELSSKAAASLRAGGHRPGDPEWEAQGVSAKVTRPRIETVVSGVRADGSVFSAGHDENVAFFKLTYEDENLVALGRRFDAVAPLLWLKAGGVGPVVRRRGEALWALPSGARYGVLFAPAHAKAFTELITVHDRDLHHLFVVTDSESEFQEAVAYLPPELRLETTRLYADYLRSFEINGKG
ncbi:site-specific DNA-methyltransferase [Microbacterium sp. NPDC077184]|uniref:site-specific DNA-methyltransferase n=1 Tax=Microbacterium sp. NPDC077184 TaxID=3154764 RepID=UPI003417068F